MRGLFVTGTDTGVGKTVVSAALLAAMAAAGETVRAHKPVVTGLAETEAGGTGAWPPDHELLGEAAGMAPDEVAPVRFGQAAAPHLAAELSGAQLDPRTLLQRALAAGAPTGSARIGAESPQAAVGPVLVVEGVGGLLVPLAPGYTVRDLAAELGLAVVIAARPGLGTINHTLLTLESARAAGLRVRAVVLTPWPAEPGALERSNRETIERLGDVEVATLARVPSASVVDLARAGATLPWRDWLASD